MKKVLYASGDSFVFGMECKEHYNRDPDNKLLAFPKYLADLLGCDTYVNNAYNGATNEFIFRKTLFDLIELESNGVDPKDVFVVIGITTLHRIEVDGDRFFEQIPPHFVEEVAKHPMFPVEYHEYKTIFANPGFNFGVTHYKTGADINIEKEIVPWCSKYIWTENVQLASQEARIISLHTYLKAKGYNHVFVNTVCPLERTKHLKFDNPNFYKLDSDSFYTWAKSKHPAHLRKYNHFSTVPHQEYAHLLFEYVKK